MNRRRWRAALQKELEQLEADEERLAELAADKGASVTLLLGLVASSGEMDQVKDEGALARLGRNVLAGKERFAYLLKKGFRRVFEGLVAVLSRPSVKINVRPPHIRGAALVAVEAELRGLLQPCDVFLHKTAYQANDWIIPGYFSHAGMWLGSYEEAQALGLFERGRNRHSYEQAQRYRQHMQAGHSLLEGLFTGVALNDFRGYMLPCDTIAVLRPRPEYIAGQQGEVIARALRHVGQVYDFGFDVNTYDTIVCSELIYQAYPKSIPWQTKNILGRPTFSPDAIGMQASRTAPAAFEVVYFHDGTRSWQGTAAAAAFWQRCGDALR